MTVETVERMDVGQLVAKLDRLATELLAVKEQVERLGPPAEVIEWAQRVNQAHRRPRGYCPARPG